MPPVRYQPNRLIATATRSGSASLSIFRMTNWFIRGSVEHSYAECYGGSLDLEEDLPMEAITGTIATVADSNVITGTGTAFREELHPLQRLQTSDNQVLIVREVFSDTSMIVLRPADNTASGLIARRMRVLFPLGVKRGSLLTGNILEYDRGTLLAVGSGAAYVNGSLLPGDSLVASRRPQIALRETSGDYLVQILGFTAPAGITAAPSSIPAASLFASTDLNTATDTINDVAHGFSTGQQVKYTSSGTLFSVAGSAVTVSRTFYIIRIDADNYQLADSLANAVGGTELDLTAQGSGNHTATPVSKVMPEGVRSLLVSKASTKLGVPSFGNPSAKILVAALTSGQAIAVTFPAMDSNADPNDPHDAWRIEGSLQGGSLAQAILNSESGPWFWTRTVDSSEVSSAGGTYILEYLDSEITSSARLVTFDNEIEVDAEYIASAAGYPVLVSCSGPPTPEKPKGTSPGPTIVPFKPHNIAAAPLVLDTGQRNEVPTSPPEPIIGFYLAAGRIYLMTPNTLQIAVFTADPDFPVQTRPFWKSGFLNPYAVCFVNGTLYGFTSKGPTRSATDGEPGSEEFTFAADVSELMLDWQPENVFVCEDMQNQCINYVHSGYQLNGDGFWETEILSFMLGNQSWCRHLVTSSTEDRIVSGVASVDGHMEFLAGGRLPGSTFGSRTLRFDGGGGDPVPHLIGWQLSDAGEEQRPKQIKHPRVIGKLTAANFGIHGAEVGEEIDIDVFEAGNVGSKTGAIGLASSNGILWGSREEVIVTELMTFAPMIVGEWDGVLPRDRIDEVILDVMVRGSRR
jgi:hypothetical protein